MARPRLTVRRLMITVAIVALLMAFGIQARWVFRNVQEYSRRALMHSSKEAFGREESEYEKRLAQSLVDRLTAFKERIGSRDLEECSSGQAHGETDRADELRRSASYKAYVKETIDVYQKEARYHARDAEEFRHWIEYHSSLRAKYEAAMRRPWVSISPDPTYPEWRSADRAQPHF
jgi:hypothetical protein